jgi:hypothetical protein
MANNMKHISSKHRTPNPPKGHKNRNRTMWKKYEQQRIGSTLAFIDNYDVYDMVKYIYLVVVNLMHVKVHSYTNVNVHLCLTTHNLVCTQ